MRHVVLLALALVVALLGAARGSGDITCDSVANTSVDVSETLSSSFFKRIERNRISIVAKTVVLDGDAKINFDPCKDLVIDAVAVVLKGTIQFRARNVTINAINVTIVGTSSTLDSSYVAPGLPDYHGQAPSGKGYGDRGQDGRDGGTGGTGGSISITMSTLNGGDLFLRADGGSGGMGESGGDGHPGEPGEPNSDLTACCHPRSTAGFAGKTGGDAGAPGKSGNGGRGGSVAVNLPPWANRISIMTRVKISVSGGKPGAEAQPGNPGDGGIGGVGSPTKCYNAGSWIDKKHRCKGTLGASGAMGSAGSPARVDSPASAGASGKQRVRVGSIANTTPLPMLRIAMMSANSEYKKSSGKAARYIYLWIREATENSTDKYEQSMNKLARTYLVQLAHGFDFWGHAYNYVSMVSYSTLYDHLKDDVIPYAIDVEKDFDDYQNKATSMERHRSIAQNSIQHMRVLVQTSNGKIAKARSSLDSIRIELQQLQLMQEFSLYRSQAVTEVCQNAVQNYIAHKDAITFGDILKIVFSAITVGIDVGKFAVDAYDGDVAGAADDAKSTIEDGETLVKDIKTVVDKKKKFVTDEANAVARFNEIKGQIDETGKENTAKLLVEKNSFDALIHKWLFLPECKDSEADFTAYINSSSAVNNKLMQHDAVVIQISHLETTVQRYEDEAAQMQSEISTDFNPFTLSYAQAIEHVYMALKDSVVDELKQIQEAYNYQFLSSQLFSLDDSRMAMIEAWLANNRIDMLEAMSTYGRSVQIFNKDVKPLTNTIVLERKKLVGSFEQLDKSNQISFFLSGSEDLFAPWTQVRMTGVKAWLVGLESSNERVRVWMKRLGTSLLFDRRGEPWTFTHGSRVMSFSYNKRNLDDETVTEYDGDDDELVSLSPLGPWILSVDRAYNPGVDTRKVKEIHLQITGTFLPCDEPKCPIRRPAVNLAILTNTTSFPNATLATTTGMPQKSGNGKALFYGLTGLGGVMGVAFLSILIFAIWKQKSKRNKQQFGPYYRERTSLLKESS